MELTITKYEKFLDVILDSMLQLTFMKTAVVILSKAALSHTVKEEHLQLSEKLLNYSFPIVYLYEVGFSSYPSIKTA